MPKPIDNCSILYVEDDDATAYLFQIALRESGVQPQIFRVTNGGEALAFLSRQGAYGDAPLPDLVLLDLNLPGRNGFEVLTQIRGLAGTESLPVYVFSTSANPMDKAEAASRGATGYLLKGESFEAFVDTAKRVCSYLTDSDQS